ncbi:hypothetical protein BUALT_Bualt05G0076200 [Buddleja alternifolia]|uniref:Uncharacterized protein n=1 Tax=Buddleja alternifolia TaxID=168488 RepID=A0AAV6XIY0_9LAMI|nr:hypothetical protein BUALT_Bualt05G0076200 [Buddleja alternifolia]
MEAVGKRVGMAAAVSSAPCIFCQIARSSTSTTLLHKDDKVVAFQDINPSAFRFSPLSTFDSIRFDLVWFISFSLSLKFQTATIMYALGCCPAQCTITILAVIVYAHDRDLLVSRRKVYGYNTIPEYESREVWEDPLWTLVSISKSPRTLNSERKWLLVSYTKPFPGIRHYLVIPIEHISTVKDLQRRSEDFLLVNHMLNVGQSLIQRDAPHVRHYRYAFIMHLIFILFSFFSWLISNIFRDSTIEESSTHELVM